MSVWQEVYKAYLMCVGFQCGRRLMGLFIDVAAKDSRLSLRERNVKSRSDLTTKNPQPLRERIATFAERKATIRLHSLLIDVNKFVARQQHVTQVGQRHVLNLLPA